MDLKGLTAVELGKKIQAKEVTVKVVDQEGPKFETYSKRSSGSLLRTD